MKTGTSLTTPTPIEALKTLRLIAHLGSFSKAAAQRQVATSSVSRLIEQLEDTLGLRLVERTGKQVALTVAGAELLARGENLINDWQALEAAWSDLGDAVAQPLLSPTGVLRIGCSITFGEAFLLGLLPDFLARHTGIEIELTFTDHYLDLIDAQLDVSIYLGQPPSSSFRFRHLGTCSMALAASPAYLQRRGTPRVPADLAAHDCLTFHEHGRRFDTWSFTAGDGRQQQVPVRGRIVSNNTRSKTELLLAHQGIGAGLLHVLQPHFDSGALVQLLPDYTVRLEGLANLDVYALHPSPRALPARTTLFIDFIADCLRIR